LTITLEIGMEVNITEYVEDGAKVYFSNCVLGDIIGKAEIVKISFDVKDDITRNEIEKIKNVLKEQFELKYDIQNIYVEEIN